MELNTGSMPPTQYQFNDIALGRLTHLPVASSASLATKVQLTQIHATANPGDKFRIESHVRVTNDVGVDPTTRAVVGARYTIGFSAYIWWKVTGSTGQWTQVGRSTGGNVTVPEHHLQLGLIRGWEAPPEWVPETGVSFAMFGCAASSQWNSNGGTDVLTVDNYSMIDLFKWSAS